MKKAALISLSLLLFGGSAIMAMAAEPMEGHEQGSMSMGHMGEHDMTGTVAKLNHKKGTLELKSKPANLRLHFPPESLKDIKNGDKITVHLSFSKG